MDTTRQADVIVPAYRDTPMTLRCLRSVLELSGPALRRLIVIDDASPEPEMAPALRRLAETDPRVVVLNNESNLGFVAACNRGLAERAGDAVLLNSDTLVTRGWLAELAEVAYTDERTGCATPLSNNATLCSVPRFGGSTPVEALDEATARAACAELPRSTVVPTGVGFCLYLRGEVLDLVGGLDPVFGLGYNEENDWAMRAQAMGFVARRANRALVYHIGSVSFQSQRTELDERNARILNERHPHYLPQVRRFCTTLDSRLAAHAVRAAATGTLAVALDLRHVPPISVGTSVCAINLAQALARLPGVELTLVVRQPSQAEGIPGRVVVEGQSLGEVAIIHRIGQVFDPLDLELLFGTPAHTIITHLDLIAHRAQAIFPDQPSADQYRSMSYLVLHAAQATIAISQHARNEILAEYGVPEETVFVTPLGVERDRFAHCGPDGRDLRRARGVPDRYFLSIATDFPHKNLVNLIEAYALLRARWRGDAPPALVLIGNKVLALRGFYEQLEAAPRDGVVYLGSVQPDELRALLRGTEALVYPSVYEGFGLPILEAMAAGAPVVALPFASIPEVGGDSVLYPAGASRADLARALERLCDDPALRAELIERGRRRAEQFHWERTARLTIEAYRSVLFRPCEQSLTARRHLLDVLPGWARIRSLNERIGGLVQDQHRAAEEVNRLHAEIASWAERNDVLVQAQHRAAEEGDELRAQKRFLEERIDGLVQAQQCAAEQIGALVQVQRRAAEDWEQLGGPVAKGVARRLHRLSARTPRLSAAVKRVLRLEKVA
jgi:glycosyltransferase involved in cell wall biosynthesis